MRSPAESERAGLRAGLESLAHAAALGLLAWLLIRSLSGGGPGPAEIAGARELPAALAGWSTVERPSRVHAVVDDDLSPAALAWLVALARTGTPVTWNGNAAAVAAVNDPAVDPAGGSRILVAARGGIPVTLTDGYGPLDSVTAGGSGATFLAHSGPRWVRARAGILAARAELPDSLVFAPLLLLGRVGWESKFVAAALEERGWTVDARLSLSPKGDVTQGDRARADTGRYSAVIVLDSTAAGLADIGPYVRSGGGAVLAAQALSAPALRALGALRPGPALPPRESFDTTAADPRSSLGLFPISEGPGQLVLESRSGQPAVVARRIERGRLIVMGYQDTWRWRMSGRGNAADRHRDWWAGLVSGVARVGRVPLGVRAGSVDEAPLAHLIDRLGPAAPPGTDGTTGLMMPNGLLFGALAGLLLLEWASRRLRGAR